VFSQQVLYGIVFIYFLITFVFILEQLTMAASAITMETENLLFIKELQ
jgi:hypothetical protein